MANIFRRQTIQKNDGCVGDVGINHSICLLPVLGELKQMTEGVELTKATTAMDGFIMQGVKAFTPLLYAWRS
jgi:hypothetical protein